MKGRGHFQLQLTGTISCPAANSSSLSTVNKQRPVGSLSSSSSLLTDIQLPFVPIKQRPFLFWDFSFKFKFMAVWIRFLTSDELRGASQVLCVSAAASLVGSSLCGCMGKEKAPAERHKNPNSVMSLIMETVRICQQSRFSYSRTSSAVVLHSRQTVD